MVRLFTLAAAYFAVLALILAALLASTLLYHLLIVDGFESEQGAVHVFFVPGWRQLSAVVLLAYVLCIAAAWLRLLVKHRIAQ